MHVYRQKTGTGPTACPELRDEFRDEFRSPFVGSVQKRLKLTIKCI